MTLTQQQIDHFQTDGVVLLKGVFSDFVEEAQQAVDENMAAPSWRERTYHPEDGGQAFFQDYVVWNQFDGYRKLVTQSPMAALASQLMKSRTARIYHDHILVKEPGNSTVTPWHQDQPYYLCEGKQSVSFWVPLDDVPRERSIEYIAGSHKWEKSFKPQRFDGTDLFANDKAEAVPDIEADKDNFSVVGWDVTAGDAIAFTFRTLHGAPANSSSMRRRVISVRWVGDDAVFAVRPGPTSPAFPELSYTDGQPFEGPDFPILFER